MAKQAGSRMNTGFCGYFELPATGYGIVWFFKSWIIFAC